METAGSVVKDALVEILVQAVEAPVQPAQMQNGIRYLNRMMLGYAARGINLGYTTVSNMGDLVTVPDGALNGIVANLAKLLCRQYDKPLTQDLEMRARDGLYEMRKLGVSIGPSLYPPTLPVGSGNENDLAYNEFFYGQPSEPILTEQGGYISVESETDLP